VFSFVTVADTIGIKIPTRGCVSPCLVIATSSIAAPAVCPCRKKPIKDSRPLFFQAEEFVISNLTDASRELFKRQPDECFPSLTALWEHCQRQKEACVDRWVAPRSIRTNPHDAGRLLLAAGDDGAFEMNDWSFGQLCRLAGVAKETVNRLVPDTTARVFATDFEAPPEGVNGSAGLYASEQDMFTFVIEPTGCWRAIMEYACPLVVLLAGDTPVTQIAKTPKKTCFSCVSIDC